MDYSHSPATLLPPLPHSRSRIRLLCQGSSIAKRHSLWRCAVGYCPPDRVGSAGGDGVGACVFACTREPIAGSHAMGICADRLPRTGGTPCVKACKPLCCSKTLLPAFSAPVLALALLAHGATLQNLSLFIGAYSFTVIAVEFPSGLFADLYGRKTAFVISTLLYLCCYGLLLCSHSGAMLLAAMIFNGLGRAFSSGSIDALAIDEAADDDALVKVTARLSMLESAGLSVGALAGRCSFRRRDRVSYQPWHKHPPLPAVAGLALFTRA